MLDEKFLENLVAKKVQELINNRMDKLLEDKISDALDDRVSDIVEDVKNDLDLSDTSEFTELEERVSNLEGSLQGIRDAIDV